MRRTNETLSPYKAVSGVRVLRGPRSPFRSFSCKLLYTIKAKPRNETNDQCWFLAQKRVMENCTRARLEMMKRTGGALGPYTAMSCVKVLRGPRSFDSWLLFRVLYTNEA